VACGNDLNRELATAKRCDYFDFVVFLLSYEKITLDEDLHPHGGWNSRKIREVVYMLDMILVRGFWTK
jgi:hypothetical protein